jgi:hypothetical protein
MRLQAMPARIGVTRERRRFRAVEYQAFDKSMTAELCGCLPQPKTAPRRRGPAAHVVGSASDFSRVPERAIVIA